MHVTAKLLRHFTSGYPDVKNAVLRYTLTTTSFRRKRSKVKSGIDMVGTLERNLLPEQALLEQGYLITKDSNY